MVLDWEQLSVHTLPTGARREQPSTVSWCLVRKIMLSFGTPLKLEESESGEVSTPPRMCALLEYLGRTGPLSKMS